jgi:hypothetical protein
MFHIICRLIQTFKLITFFHKFYWFYYMCIFEKQCRMLHPNHTSLDDHKIYFIHSYNILSLWNNKSSLHCNGGFVARIVFNSPVHFRYSKTLKNLRTTRPLDILDIICNGIAVTLHAHNPVGLECIFRTPNLCSQTFESIPDCQQVASVTKGGNMWKKL